MTESQAIQKAKQLSKKRGKEYLVIFEGGEYDYVKADLYEEYFEGARIVYSTER